MAITKMPASMTVDEFMVWDDGTDTRYELVDGHIVAMAPPRPAHGAMVVNIARRLSEALDKRPPRRVYTKAGVRHPEDTHSFLIPDAVVSCAPINLEPGTLDNPVVIIEVLSPSTRLFDQRVKLRHYRAIPSVREIVLIDCLDLHAELHRRLDDGHWRMDQLAGLDELLVLESVGVSLPLSALYDGIPVEPLAITRAGA